MLPTASIQSHTSVSDSTRHDFSMPNTSRITLPKGLSHDIVTRISALKDEPSWMRDHRHAGYTLFTQKPLPSWGPDLHTIDFDEITYFSRATDAPAEAWENLPDTIKETYNRIGVPEHEKAWLSGVSAQYESEVVYGSLKKELAEQGVIFCDMDTALREHPSLVQKYFGTLVPASDNTFAALNTAVWSGGSFIYVPPGVQIALPVQAYFRINAERFGQFERTLIIADKDSSVHYVEGCTAPTYTTASLHAAAVENFIHDGATVRCTTVLH